MLNLVEMKGKILVLYNLNCRTHFVLLFRVVLCDFVVSVPMFKGLEPQNNTKKKQTIRNWNYTVLVDTGPSVLSGIRGLNKHNIVTKKRYGIQEEIPASSLPTDK